MFRRLINRLQGKVWSASCYSCLWSSGAKELTNVQAHRRAKMHNNNEHYGRGNIVENDKFKSQRVRLTFF